MSGDRVRALRTHLDATLFPGPRPSDGAAPGALALSLLSAGLVLVGTILVMLRPGWGPAIHTIWAEDGSIFLHGAVTEGSGAILFHTYSNYLVLVPRLIAEGATVVSLEHAPAVISGLSALLTALSGLVVWFATADHIRNSWLRLTLAVATVLVPVSGLESLDSGAYVSWYMIFAAFWVLLWRPRTTAAAAVAAVFVLVAALSNPIIWLLTPLALLRAAAIRDRRDGLIVGSFALGSLIQVPVTMTSNEPVPVPAWSKDILTAYLQRVVDGASFGERLGGSLWAHFGWPFLIALCLAVLVAAVLVARQVRRGAVYLLVIAAAVSAAMFLISLYQRAVGPEMIWPGGTWTGAGGRYVIIPALLLLSAAIVLVDDLARRIPGRTIARGLIAATVALVVLAIATSFDMEEQVARGIPTWGESVSAAAAKCVAKKSETAEIENSPNGVGFFTVVPCNLAAEEADH